MTEARRFQQLWKARLRLEIWISCVVLSVLIAVAQFFSLVGVDRIILGKPFLALRLPYLVVSIVCLVLLLHQREKLGFQVLQRMIVGLTVATLPYMWISQGAFAASGNPWIPFYGFEISALVIVTFRYGSGVLLNVFFLVALTIESAAFWFRFHFGSDMLLVKSGYVWNVLLTGVCATALLTARYHYERTLRKLIELEVRAATAEMTARVFLKVRDRANSPLQTLEIGLALHKRRQPENPVVDALLGALKEIVDLHETFKPSKAEPFLSDEAEWLAAVDRESRAARNGATSLRRAKPGRPAI